MNNSHNRSAVAQGAIGSGAFVKPLSQDLLNRTIAVCHSIGGDHWIPVLRAVRDCRLVVIQIPREARAVRLPQGRQWLATFLDDDAAPTGPDGFRWRVIYKLASASKIILVHGTGADTEHYAAATRNALHHGSALIVETSSGFADKWLSQLRGINPKAGFLILRPPPGQVHPSTPEVLQ